MSQNPHFKLVTGDFNVLLSSWWKDDLKISIILLSAMAEVSLFVNLYIFCKICPHALI